jgi:hypothetical protein
MCLIPNLTHTNLQIAEVNWEPLSEVMAEGTPNLAIQPENNASAQCCAEVLDKGMASAHLLVLSTIVNRWVKPSLEIGKGPTKSTCTCENLMAGMGMGTTGALACVTILATEHLWQSLTIWLMKGCIPFHTNLAEINLLVALEPAWAMPCKE